MQLKDYIPNINKKFGNIFFSGIAFESQKVKKNNIFLQSKELIGMEIILYLAQLKKVLK